MKKLIDFSNTYIDENGKIYVCSGCAHSIGDAKFPGGPSGERPCFLCIRNVKREDWQKDYKERYGHELKEWYNESKPTRYPMDCYHTCDMKDQFSKWEDWIGPLVGR